MNALRELGLFRHLRRTRGRLLLLAGLALFVACRPAASAGNRGVHLFGNKQPVTAVSAGAMPGSIARCS